MTPAGEQSHAPQVVALSVGPLQANAYLLIVGDEAVVVDPGEEGGRLAAEISRRGARLKAVWLTHAHFDHVGGLAALLRAAGSRGSTGAPSGPVTLPPVHLHPEDRPLLSHAVAAAGRWGIAIEEPPQETVPTLHGDTLTVGGVEATALHTPGHAPGHLAYYLPAAGVVLSGDALFRGSIGRTDLPLGDHELLLRSIRDELLTLPDETVVLSGHGPATTIGAERFGNPFL